LPPILKNQRELPELRHKIRKTTSGSMKDRSKRAKNSKKNMRRKGSIWIVSSKASSTERRLSDKREKKVKRNFWQWNWANPL
jgi:hypothetical protein